MEYKNMVPGQFIARPNRFIAHVEIGGETQVVHVKNTGRCRELLPAGAKVWCQEFDSPTRKTKYDLITVQKGQRLINMDSQAPNTAAKEWLSAGGLGELENLRSEVFHGDSRFDFAFLKDGRQCFLEVKGVTLEQDGVCAFPDAPTERGKKHLLELQQAVENGYEAWVLFVLAMPDMVSFEPNWPRDPDFSEALCQVAKHGVQVKAVECAVTEDSIEITKDVPVGLF